MHFGFAVEVGSVFRGLKKIVLVMADELFIEAAYIEEEGVEPIQELRSAFLASNCFLKSQRQISWINPCSKEELSANGLSDCMKMELLEGV